MNSSRHIFHHAESPSLLMWFLRLFPIVGLLSVGMALVFGLPAQPAHAAGVLTVEIIASPNLVVDADILSSASPAPQTATVIGKFCNTGDAVLTNVIGSIGDFNGASSTAGIYPSRASGVGAFDTQHPLLAGSPGVYTLSHLGSAADASRLLGNLAPDECRYEYWSFTYPLRENGAASGDNLGADPVWGSDSTLSDDLYLDFDVWATADSYPLLSAPMDTQQVTLRSMTSTLANKIKPSPNGEWYSTPASTVYPGQTITLNGKGFSLGAVTAGFDSNGDGFADTDAWLQPFGDPSFDPDCFRLLETTGVLTVTRPSPLPPAIISFSDTLYFRDLPADNTNVTGEVHYTFLALGGACTLSATPFQTAAAGSNNLGFNSDYGTSVPLMTYSPEVALDKTGPEQQAENTTFTYAIGFQNNSTTADAGLSLSVGLGGSLVISDTVPLGLSYVGGSASSSNTIPAGNSVQIRWSTDSGKTWVASDPGTVASSTAKRVVIQWRLTEPLSRSGSGSNAGTVRYQASIPSGYLAGGGDIFIRNCVDGSFGDGAAFATDCASTRLSGNNSIGDKIWADVNANGIDESEAALNGIVLYLYWDKDADGVFDDADPRIAQATTSGGVYSFPDLPDSRYFVEVDISSAPDGYRPTSPVSGRMAVNLNGVGNITNTTTDFGLIPALSVNKTSLESLPTASNGTITYKIELKNNLLGSGSTTRACQYDVWSSVQDTAHSGTGQTSWLNISNIFGSPNTTYATDPLAAAPESLAVSGFTRGDPGETITKVELLLPYRIVGTVAGEAQIDVISYSTLAITVIKNVVPAGTQLSALVNKYTLWQTGDASGALNDWASYTGNVLSVWMEGKKSGNNTDWDVDAVGFRLTTSGACADNSADITYAPLTDTYDATKLEFVSASVNPNSPITAGTLTWSNLGPLYAGGMRDLYVTFRVKAEATAALNNTATSSGSKFGDGLPVNSPVSDVEPIKGVVGDRVFFDVDGDRTQDAGETGISGVTVRLCSLDNCSTGNNVLYATTTTDSNGNYLFSGLEFGATYYVVVTPPGGYTGSSGYNGGAYASSFAFTPSSSNVIDLKYDWGFDTSTANAGGVSGYIWNDINASGTAPQTGEGGFSSVSVRLCTGTPGGTCTQVGADVTTDANGFYQFSNVTAGTNYFVRVSALPAATRTYEYNALCSGACDGDTANFTVSANAITGGINLGYRAAGTATLGNLVFRDWNGDAIQDTGEEGISGIAVTLYLDNDNDGLVDTTDYLYASTTTAADGSYQFSSVAAGNYIVAVTTPANTVQTKDPDESDVCAVCDSLSRQTGVDGTSTYSDHDFAFKPSGALSIGDLVYRDMNGNGAPNSGDAGIPGITVWLYEDTANNDGYDSAADALIATASTDAAGKYLFSGLPAGEYVVVVDSSDPQLPTNSGGAYVPSTVTTVAVTLSANNVNTADFGFMPKSSIGDTVYSDNNGNGLQDAGEPGIPSVTVSLYLDADNNGAADGAAIAAKTTDASGKYLFAGLLPNNYIVVVTLPSGYTQTGDPDAPTQPCGAACNHTYWLKGYTAPDSTFISGLPAGTNHTGGDFGYKPNSGVLGDYVWIDINGDGIQAAGEPGISGVTITLAGPSCSPSCSLVTDSSGNWSKAGLADGSYTVSVNTATLPGGASRWANTYDPNGGADSTASVSLSGNSNLAQDFGYRLSGARKISGVIFYDAGGSGDGLGDTYISGADPATYSGIAVILRDSNGVLVASTTTNSSGYYEFAAIPDGSYIVYFDAASLPSLSITASPDGGADNSAPVAVSGVDATQQDFGLTGHVDFDDLPDNNYFTSAALNGPSHTIGNVYFGAAAPTADYDGKPGSSAILDTDLGITRSALYPWLANETVHLNVTVTDPDGAAFLAIWFDFNRDNDFADAGELRTYNVTGSSGGTLNDITLTLPSTFDGNQPLAVRYRLYDFEPATISALGAATNGEVQGWIYSPQTTPVTLAYFETRATGNALHFDWSTDTETGNLGFNLYAENASGLVKLNEELIPSAVVNSMTRQDYSYAVSGMDESIFWIEDVDLMGVSKLHGPFELGQAYGERLAQEAIDWAAIRARAERGQESPLAREKGAGSKGLANGAAANLASDSEAEVQNLLAPQAAVKKTVTYPTAELKVTEAGIYRVTYEALKAAGLEYAGADVKSLALLNRGKPVAIETYSRGKFGPGAYFEFYGEGLDTLYTKTNVYRLVVDKSQALRIVYDKTKWATKAAIAPYYLETATYEKNAVYSFYSPTDDPWMSKSMTVYNARPQGFDFPLTVEGYAGGAATLKVRLVGVTDWPQTPDHHVVVKFNGTVVADLKFDGLAAQEVEAALPAGLLAEGANTLRLEFPADTGVVGEVVDLDEFSVIYPRSFQVKDGTLAFSGAGAAFRVLGVQSKDVRAYRLDANGRPVRLERAIAWQYQPGLYWVTFGGAKTTERYVFAEARKLKTPAIAKARATEDLNSGSAQYLVLSHPAFINNLGGLVNARQAQGLSVKVVDVQAVYAQYGHGIFDPAAIKSYIKYAQVELGTQYVLLVGGDTYDYRNDLGYGSLSFIPSLYARTGGIVAYAPADTLYGDVDDDGLVDVAVGRLPVRTTVQLDALVGKILTYQDKTYGMTAVLAADKKDGALSFSAINDAFAAGLPANWTVTKAYIDSLGVAGARTALLNSLNNGVALTVYTGHSSPDRWTFSGLFTSSSAASLTNAGKPTVVVQWGCWNTYYVDPAYTTLADKFLLAGDRGAASVFGAVTLTEAESEMLLGQYLMPKLVQPGMTLGRALVEAKRALAQADPNRLDVLLGWSLLGDPALVVQP